MPITLKVATWMEMLRMIAAEVWCCDELAVQMCMNSTVYHEQSEPDSELTPEGCEQFTMVARRPRDPTVSH